MHLVHSLQMRPLPQAVARHLLLSICWLCRDCRLWRGEPAWSGRAWQWERRELPLISYPAADASHGFKQCLWRLWRPAAWAELVWVLRCAEC